jgi:hypothetical protein
VRLVLEHLEPRLAPGDGLLGWLVGGSLLDGPLAPPEAAGAMPERAAAGSWAGGEERDADVLDLGWPWPEAAAPASRPGGTGSGAASPESFSLTPAPGAEGWDPAAPGTAYRLPLGFLALAVSPGGVGPAGAAAPSGFRVLVAEVPAPAADGPAPVAGLADPAGAPRMRDAAGPAASAPSFAQGDRPAPMYFERNVGQVAAPVDYLARAGNATIFLTPTAAVFAIQGSGARGQRSEIGRPGAEPEAPRPGTGVALYMDVVGANPAARAAGVSPLAGKLNYFIGNDPSKWHTNVPTFGRVEYPNVHPGISLAYYGGPGGLEYDFAVSPGADPRAIALKFEGATGIDLSPQGDLVVHTAAGDLVQHAPALYQVTEGLRQPVSGRFALTPELGTPDSDLLTFDVGPYDHARPLVIDPLVLGYSTYFGGSAFDDSNGIAVDGTGAAYITGQTGSLNLPTTPGAFDTSFNGGTWDGFVTKLNASGSALVYSTYLGGSKYDYGWSIAVDGAGQAYVTGRTNSNNFPVTPGAFQAKDKGGTDDVFVTKLSADGSALEYSTYLGGSENEQAGAIAVDPYGDAYVHSLTYSADFPVTPGAFDRVFDGSYCGSLMCGDAFVTKLNPSGSALVYSTFLGGSGVDIGTGVAVDGAGDAYLTGVTGSPNFPVTPGAFDTTFHGGPPSAPFDGYVAKLNADGTALVYATYLGGSGLDEGEGVFAGPSGVAYVAGHTTSADFPVTPGAFQSTFGGGGSWGDAFAAALSADGSSLVYSTYLGGPGVDYATSVAVDGSGSAYITGACAGGFPVTPDGFQTTFGGGPADAFVVKLGPDGTTLLYGTYLGGSNDDGGRGVARDGSGNLYVTGGTESANFPVTPDALKRRNRDGMWDAFVSKFADV